MCKALPDSWKTEPFPNNIKVLDYSRIFTESEHQTLALGLVQVTMEDEWFMYFHDNVLNLHRGWTGHCIYQVKLQEKPTDTRL